MVTFTEEILNGKLHFLGCVILLSFYIIRGTNIVGNNSFSNSLTDISKQKIFVKKAEDYVLMSSHFPATLVLLNFIILFLFLPFFIRWNCEIDVTTAADF